MSQSMVLCEVLDSARYIFQEASHVQVKKQATEEVARKLLPHFLLSHKRPSSDEATPTPMPANLSSNEMLEWTFLLDTLNFCFWSDEPTLFSCRYKGVQWTGYRSLCAALAKAVEEGVPVYKPSYYGNVSLEEFKKLFVSDTHVEMPMLEQRRENLIEAATALNKEFGGEVSELIRRSKKSAQRLVSLLLRHFPSYRDVGTYRGKKVKFLKRAQIFAADVWHRFEGRGFGEFHDIDSLTMFADYRVPQSLQYFGVLEYSEELMGKLQRGEHLEAGGVMEAEIRGCSIWAVELIREKMCALLKSLPSSVGVSGDDQTPPTVNSVTIDFFLWEYAKSHIAEMNHFPIHRTHTIFY